MKRGGGSVKEPISARGSGPTPARLIVLQHPLRRIIQIVELPAPGRPQEEAAVPQQWIDRLEGRFERW